MIRLIFGCLLALTLNSGQELPRPRIVGLAHISLYAHEMDSAKRFYGEYLGFAQPFSLPNMLFFKVNDRQFIEVAPEKEVATDRLSHYAVEVEDAEAMRGYLASKGVAVPAQVPKGRIGNLNFMIHDPEGRAIEIVQYPADGLTAKTRSQFMPAARVSTHMRHVGFVVTNLDAEMKFYVEVLGFREFWRGSSNGTTLSWINMKLPDSEDYVEFMLYKDAPAPDKRGSANHLCLLVDDVTASKTALKAKNETRIGVNRKRQLNLFDDDGTRTELMEPTTVDGKAAASSSAPPPQ